MAIGKSKKQLLSIQRAYDALNYDTIPVTNIIDINPEAVGEDINLITSKMGGKRNYNDRCHTTATFNIETYFSDNFIEYDNAGIFEKHSILETLLIQSGMKVNTATLSDVIVEYVPDSDSNNQSNMLFYKEDIKRTITGAKNSMTITGEVGKPISVVFNNSAYTDLVPTIEAPTQTDASFDDLFILCKIQGYTEDGTTVNLQSFTLNQNTELQDTYSIGLSQFDMTDFDYQIETTALKIKNDISNWQEFEAASTKEIIITCESPVNKQKLEITISGAKMLTNVDGDDAGRQTIVRNFRCENDLGDDNISIKFTDAP